jgi:tetratricopeptide (TPR) repeat protein
MVKSVETVERIPSMENVSERSKRISAARSLLAIISTKDEKLWNRLEAVLSIDESSSEAEKSANADALIETALTVVDTDPKRAESVGALSLRAGRSTLLHHLLIRLRLRDAAPADRLFAEALVVAQSARDEGFLNSLRYAAFPELYGPDLNAGSVPPESLRAEVLQLLEDDLQQQVAMTVDSGTPSCAIAVSMIVPLQAQFDRLEPQSANLARQLIKTCQERLNPGGTGQAAAPQADGSPMTVDELLSAADAATEGTNQRAIYLGKAAQLAAQQKKFELAISILDRMSDEERRFIGIWETWRRDWAVSLAVDYLKRDDLPGMNQVIKAVPENLRALTEVSLVDKLPVGSADIAIQLVEEARKGLNGSDKPDSEKLHWHMMITRLYAKYQLPTQALEAFKEAISDLNHSEESTARDKNTSDGFDQRLIQDNFPTSLLDPHDFLIRDIVLSINALPKRTQAELGLIRVSMKRYQELASILAKAPSNDREKK